MFCAFFFNVIAKQNTSVNGCYLNFNLFHIATSNIIIINNNKKIN